MCEIFIKQGQRQVKTSKFHRTHQCIFARIFVRRGCQLLPLLTFQQSSIVAKGMLTLENQGYRPVVHLDQKLYCWCLPSWNCSGRFWVEACHHTTFSMSEHFGNSVGSPRQKLCTVIDYSATANNITIQEQAKPEKEESRPQELKPFQFSFQILSMWSVRKCKSKYKINAR